MPHRFRCLAPPCPSRGAFRSWYPWWLGCTMWPSPEPLSHIAVIEPGIGLGQPPKPVGDQGCGTRLSHWPPPYIRHCGLFAAALVAASQDPCPESCARDQAVHSYIEGCGGVV